MSAESKDTAATAAGASSVAIRIKKPGGLEELYEDRLTVAAPGPNEVLVQNAYAGINFIDTYQRSGLYTVPMPFTLGREGAGVVRAVGSEVKNFSVGARVAFIAPGCYSEYVLVDVLKNNITSVPTSVSLKDACAIMLQGLTAHYLACTTYTIKSGDTVLVHAGAGGTGGLLIQIAKIKGARVLTTVSTEEKAKIARDLGADETILYTQTDFQAKVMELTGGKGVNCVYDSVGKTTWEKSLNSLKPLGTLVVFGNSSGPIPPVDPMLLMKGSWSICRPTLAHYIATPEALAARAQDLWTWMAAKQLGLRVAASFPLREAVAATRFLESRGALGKVLLTIDESLAGATSTSRL